MRCRLCRRYICGVLMRRRQCRYLWRFNERQVVLKYQSKFEGE